MDRFSTNHIFIVLLHNNYYEENTDYQYHILFDIFLDILKQGDRDLQQIEEDFFNDIVWAPRIGYPDLFGWIESPNELGFPYWSRSFLGTRIISHQENDSEENDSEFLQSGTMQYQTRDRF